MHRLNLLGVRLEDSPKESYMTHHNSKLSLLVQVKCTQHLDPLLMELKKLVVSKFNEAFSQGGLGYLGTR